jgi:hypothetical protein
MKLQSYETYRPAFTDGAVNLMNVTVQLFLRYLTESLKHYLIVYVLVLQVLKRAHMFCCESTVLLRLLCIIVHHLLSCSGGRFQILPEKQVSNGFEKIFTCLILL